MTKHEITRRAMLTGTSTAIAAAALAVPVVAAATVEPDACALATDPIDRYEAALAEFRAAAIALLPAINDWVIHRTDNAVVVAGMHSSRGQHSVRWDGPGIYELVDPPAGGTMWTVTRAPEYDSGGERWFRLSTGFKGPHEPQDWYCPERNLPKLCRKARSIDLTPQEWADVHLADYRRAMVEADPSITGWGVTRNIETGGFVHLSAQRHI